MPAELPLRHLPRLTAQAAVAVLVQPVKQAPVARAEMVAQALQAASPDPASITRAAEAEALLVLLRQVDLAAVAVAQAAGMAPQARLTPAVAVVVPVQHRLESEVPAAPAS